MNNKTKSGANPIFIVLICILSFVLLVNLVMITWSLAKGSGGYKKPNNGDMYYLTRDRYDDIASRYQEIRTDNYKLSKDVTATMAVGSYYLDRIVCETYKASGNEDRKEFYENRMNEARSKMNSFETYANRIDKLIEEYIEKVGGN